MSLIESLSSRWRRPVAEPVRHEPTAHVDILDRKPYDWSKDDVDLLTVAEPRACVVCKHGTTGRYLGADEAIPLCPRCYGLEAINADVAGFPEEFKAELRAEWNAIPTTGDIANVIAAAERFVGGE